jgi:nucleoside-diphosphate-sugar epimerase
MNHRVFVTGASGYVGGAIARHFVRSGHVVFGLTRSPERASTLAENGVQPVIGDFKEPDTYVSELKNCDSVVHAGLEAGPEASRQDQRALEAIQAAVEDGRVRRVLYTSSVWVHGDSAGAVVDETSPLDPPEIAAWRAPHEEVVLDMLEHEVTAVILRLGMVYGGSGGLFGGWFREAKDKGIIGYPQGDQHWNTVHVDDVAAAYALALEDGPSGARFLLTDESRPTVRELAEAAARAAGAKAVAWSRDEVRTKLGPFGEAMLLDLQVTSARARRELGWTPMHTSFVSEAERLLGEWRAGREAKVG